MMDSLIMSLSSSNPAICMPSSNPCLTKLSEKKKTRLMKAKCIGDLIQRYAYPHCPPTGRLSIKVEDGYLAEHRYNQKEK